MTVSNTYFITNTPGNDLKSYLTEKLQQATSFDVAVAFMSKYGIKVIRDSIEKVANSGGKVRIITGLYQAITDLESLETLYTLQKNNNNVEVRISKEYKFHYKLYCITYANGDVELIVGSSNLTSGGLKSGGELNVVMGTNVNSETYTQFKSLFTEEWNELAVPLSEQLIDRYTKLRDTLRRSGRKIKSNKSGTNATLSRILGTKSVHRVSEEPVSWKKNNKK